MIDFMHRDPMMTASSLARKVICDESQNTEHFREIENETYRSWIGEEKELEV